MRQFEKSLPMALLKARESVMDTFIPHLRANNLSPQQWRVLRFLYENEDSSMSMVSEQCFLLMPSLSRIVPNLESRGLVTRRTSPRDQRQSLLRVSADGRRLVERMAPESEARYDRITEAFGYGKLTLLYELLEELVEKLGDQQEVKRPPSVAVKEEES